MNLHVFFIEQTQKPAQRKATVRAFAQFTFQSNPLYEARSAVVLGLIEHAVGFSEQVLDLLRENKAVRARCCS